MGLSAAAPALHVLGHTTTGLPTTTLSNHPGWPRVAGAATPPDQLASMVDAIDANGWLADHDAVLTGYLPSEAHVDLAVSLVDRVRAVQPGVRVLVDPVLGDDPKGLYLPDAVALALRDRLLPRADFATPNRFELAWLSGQDVTDLSGARRAARMLRGPAEVHVTSPPLPHPQTGLLSVTPSGDDLRQRPLQHDVPHGVGDVLSALLAAGLGPGQALGHLDALIAASLGAGHLRIVAAAPTWTRAAPVPGTDLDPLDAPGGSDP